MAKDSLFMETTKIPPEKTAAEIIALLVEAGARQIATKRTVNVQKELLQMAQPP